MANVPTTDRNGCLIAPALSAAQIKQYRKELGMTQEEFAVEFGVPIGTLRRWERSSGISKATEFMLRLVDEHLRRRRTEILEGGNASSR